MGNKSLESLVPRIFPKFSTSFVLCERGGEGLECASVGEWQSHAREGRSLLGGRVSTLNLSPHPDDASYGCSALDILTGKPHIESNTDSESTYNLESRFKNLDSNLESNATESKSKNISESKKLIESTISKNLNKALPNSNNGCDSTNLAQLQNCAIFAEQKSDSNMSHEVQTASRPLRGAQSLEKGGRSALRNDCARSGYSEALSPIAEKAAAFSGLGRAGRGEHPFLRKTKQ